MARVEAEKHAERTAFVERLLGVLERFLAGRLSRAEVVAWADENRGPYHARAAWGFAHVVVESLINLDEERAGEPTVRPQDVRAFIERLTRGETRCWSRQPLLAIDSPAEQLSPRVRVEATRAWVDGLGWCSSAVFASLATENAFAFSGRTFDDGGAPLDTSFRTLEGVDPTDAASDLAEVLALHGREVVWWNPAVAVDALPRWVVWRQDDNGNRFECDRLLSRSAAVQLSDAMGATGHKQTYWVERA